MKSWVVEKEAKRRSAIAGPTTSSGVSADLNSKLYKAFQPIPRFMTS
jgi:hypothetical protein